MRKAINNNPIVQIGLLGVLGVLVAVVFMSNMGGSSEPPPAEDTTATETAAPAAAAPATAEPVAPATPAPEAAAPATAAGSSSFEASKGLDARIVEAHESGDVVILLVVKKGGLDDGALLSRTVGPVEGTPVGWADVYDSSTPGFEPQGPTTLFVTSNTNIGKFSRVAEGVALDRVPAMIVIEPPKGKPAKGESAPMPEASVTYGYRGPESIRQAVDDILYTGKTDDYAP